MSAQPHALILRSPGTNCDRETGHAFELAGAAATAVHINQLLDQPSRLDQFQILCLPGGFSYGDDIAAGKVLATQLQNRLGELLLQFRDDGKLVLGICNGFQVLIKTGLLFDDEQQRPAATLTWNESGRYLDAWVRLKVDSQLCPFLTGIEELELPIAHAEGRFVCASDSLLDNMQANHQLALRYSEPENGNQVVGNPNGSTRDIAGICDSTGRVLGMMPHPERFIDATHHPGWTREQSVAVAGHGLRIFENAVGCFS